MTGQGGIGLLGQKRFKSDTGRDFLKAGVCSRGSVSSPVMGTKSRLASKPHDGSPEEAKTGGQERHEARRSLAKRKSAFSFAYLAPG